MSANIKDVDSLGSYITLVQTQKNTTSKNQADQFSLFNNIVNSAKTVATSNLNNDNKVQGYTSGNLVGQNQYVNKSEIPSSGQMITLSKNTSDSSKTTTSLRLSTDTFDESGMVVTAILIDKSSVFTNSSIN